MEMEDQTGTDGHISYMENAEVGRKGRHYHCSISNMKDILVNNALLFLCLLGVCVGFAIGFGSRGLITADGLLWLGLPGEMYMRMLMLTILPLIIASIIAGSASLDPKSNGKISVVSLLYIIAGNAIGPTLALALFYTIQPGKDVDFGIDGESSGKNQLLSTTDIFADMIRNLIPDNIVTACFQKAQTSYIASESVIRINATNSTEKTYTRTIGVSSGTNVLGLIISCTLVGMAISKVGEIGRPVFLFFQAVSEIIIVILRWLVWFTPIGACSLIASSVAKVDKLEETFRSLGMFVLSHTVGIIFINFFLVPMTYFAVIRENPFRFLYNAARPVMTAFAPPSTPIAIPEIMITCENKHGVDKRVSRFTVPFGAALMRIGSAQFIALSCLYLARINDMEMNAADVIIVWILTTAGSLAIPGIPSASIVTIMIILDSVSVPANNIGLLIALEWYMDRLRSTSNCLCVVFGTVFTHHICRKSLRDQDSTTERRYSYQAVVSESIAGTKL